MGFQVGRSAVMAGQEYMEQNVGLSHKEDIEFGLLSYGI
jgi:hypothetical protein